MRIRFRNIDTQLAEKMETYNQKILAVIEVTGIKADMLELSQ